MSLFFHLLSASNISVKRRPQSEHESRTSPLKRQVRLDVWAEDEMDAVYNIEALYNCIKEYLQQSTEEIKYTLHPRKSEMENIDKMINCGDSSFGGAMYSCPSCGNLKFVPFRCHSRFAPLAETNIPWNALPVCPLS